MKTVTGYKHRNAVLTPHRGTDYSDFARFVSDMQAPLLSSKTTASGTTVAAPRIASSISGSKFIARERRSRSLGAFGWRTASASDSHLWHRLLGGTIAHGRSHETARVLIMRVA